VRHPDDRMQSMYRRWEREHTYERWANDVLDNGHPYAHTRQVDYKPHTPHQLLRFEWGVTDNLHIIDPDADVPEVKRESGGSVPANMLTLTHATRERILDHFAADFYQLGYHRDDA
jgi:hypothetical protein